MRAVSQTECLCPSLPPWIPMLDPYTPGGLFSEVGPAGGVINVKWGPKRGAPIWYGGLIGRGKDTWTLSPPWEDTAKRQLLEARKSAVTAIADPSPQPPALWENTFLLLMPPAYGISSSLSWSEQTSPGDESFSVSHLWSLRKKELL